MKVVFLCNIYNHYQKSLADEFYLIYRDEFCFIQTESGFDNERKKLGWNNIEAEYLINYQERRIDCEKIINEAEVVIFSACVVPSNLLNYRRKHNLLTIAYTERAFKKSDSLITFLLKTIKWKKLIKEFPNMYLLCNGAYVARDLNRMGLFKDKCYRFGYFIEHRQSDIKEIIENKEENSLFWAGRLINWKHPEYAIHAAEKLKSEKIHFHLNIVGSGQLFEKLKNMIEDKRLEDEVSLLGAKSPNEVRSYMEQSEIYLFTSDRNEGWGVVLNEAMDAGCTVITNNDIGSVPWLISDSKNGVIYKENDFEDFYCKLKLLLMSSETRKNMALDAYNTISNLWSAKVATTRLSELIKALKEGKVFDKYQEGPCSKIY